MGYYDADGFYYHEESDIADPAAGFSSLLNLPTEALPNAIHNRVVAEISADPTIIDAAEAAVSDALSTVLGLSKCVHLEAGKWVWDGPNGAAATHYLIPDHTGALVARATPFPTPDATPSLTW